MIDLLPIRTPRLVLRPFAASDVERWHDMRSRPDVHRYLYSEPDDRHSAARAVDQRAGQNALRVPGDILSVAVALAEIPSVIVGDVMLQRAAHDGAEIGFVFHPEHHGRGLATEAAAAVLRLGFAEAGLHRVVGRCDARNVASARLMTRLGMRREAHFLRNEFVKGEWTDEYVYALLSEEWGCPMVGSQIELGLR